MKDKPERFDKDLLRHLIIQAGGEGFQTRDTGRCPFHEDHSPSGSIYRGEDGVWRFKCYAGSCGFSGDYFDCLARRDGKTLSEVLPKDESHATQRNGRRSVSRKRETFPTLESLLAQIPGTTDLVSHYENGLIVIRYYPPGSTQKDIRQARKVESGYQFGGARGPNPIYRKSEIDHHDKILLVEGEKCAEAVRRFGVRATTWAGGCKNIGGTDWEPLAGKKMILWPDNDRPGVDAMRTIAQTLLDIDPETEIKWIAPEPFDLQQGGDVADFIEDMGGMEESEKKTELWKVFQSAKPFGFLADLQSHVEKTIRGERRPVHFPFQSLSYYTNALIPGNILILAGGPGVSKSLFLIQCLSHWIEIGVSVAAFLLEGDEQFHTLRVLAQKAGEPGLTDPGWIETNPEQSLSILDEHKDFIEKFSPCLTSGVGQPSDHASVIQWVEKKAKAGARIIAVDPVTLLEQKAGANTWDADRDFIKGIQSVCREHGCSFIGVSHPKKEWEKPSLNNLAGGTAYARFSDSVFWVSYADDYFTISGNAGDLPTHVDRYVSILKCRNGKGANLAIGFRWDKDSLSFNELGVIKKKSKNPAVEV